MGMARELYDILFFVFHYYQTKESTQTADRGMNKKPNNNIALSAKQDK